MLRRIPAAALLLALGACTVGPNFEPPEWLSPASWFAKKAEPIPQAPSMPVAEPIDPNWWNLFNDPQLTALERRVAGENLDVQVATVRIAESRAQLGVVGRRAVPDAERQRLLHAPEGERCRRVRQFAQRAAAPTAHPATPPAASAAAISTPFDVYQVGFDASWEVDLWGRVRRSVESATASVDGSTEARRATLLTSLAELARDYIQLRGTQAQLQIARDNVRTAQQSLQLTQQRAAGGVTTDLDVANAAAQLRTTAARDPAAGAAGVGADQRHQPAAGPAAERAAGGADPGEAGAAGAAAGAGRPAVGTRAAAARHPPGGGAAARGDRRYRRGGGELLSVGEAVRQPRAAVAPAVADVQPQCAELRRRSRRHHPDLPGRPAAGRRWSCARRSSRKRRSTTRRPCCRPGTRWTTR